MIGYQTQIASHRGGAALWPENSSIAFCETLKLDVEQIEFDVQLSADGHPVIFHDSHLDRVTNGSGPLCSLTLGELKKLEIFNGGGKIMTLQEGLEILTSGNITPRCEIKPDPDLLPYSGAIDKVISIFKEFDLVEKSVFTSFHLPTVGEIVNRKLETSDVIWLVSEQIAKLTSLAHVANMARSEGISALSFHHKLLDETSIAELRSAGTRPGAFAVLEDEAIEKVLKLGVPVFTTDRPDAAIKIRSRFSGK